MPLYGNWDHGYSFFTYTSIMVQSKNQSYQSYGFTNELPKLTYFQYSNVTSKKFNRLNEPITQVRLGETARTVTGEVNAEREDGSNGDVELKDIHIRSECDRMRTN